MKAVWIGMVAASALLMVGTAQANADLAKSSGCLNCHTVDKKLVGPALKDIAAKYKGCRRQAGSENTEGKPGSLGSDSHAAEFKGQ